MHSDRRDREKEKERDREDRARGRERDIQKKKNPLFTESPSHPSPGPPSSRRSTFDSALDSGGTTKQGRSPVLSSSSDQLERLQKDNHRANDLPASRRDYRSSTLRRSRSRSRDKGRNREQVDLPTKKPPAGSHDTRCTDVPHPLTLPPGPPKPPLQVPEVPKVPAFVSNQQAAGSAETASKGVKEVSLDEQRSAWHERIDLMFTSITARRDYTKLESDLSQIRLLSNSSLVNGMPETDRAHINAQKTALELQMEVKRKEINEITQRLVGSNFWPVLRAPQISEMERTLEDAKKHVLEVRSLLDDMKSSCAALFKASASDRIQDSDRPSKRRRLDEGTEPLGQTTNGDAELVTNDAEGELEAFRDKLTELECHLVDLENDITQRDRIISDDIELQIDARLEEEGALYPAVKSQAEIEAVVDAKNRELVRALTVTGEEIGVLAVEVAELITKVSALEARCGSLEAENQEFKNKLTQDSLDHAKSRDVLARRNKEIEAIAAALQAYISQLPAGQTTVDLPSAEYIVESLGSQLDGLLRDKFSASMINIQQEVFDKVQEGHNRTVETVSPKIVLLLKMVNLITARLGKSETDAVNTA